LAASFGLQAGVVDKIIQYVLMKAVFGNGLNKEGKLKMSRSSYDFSFPDAVKPCQIGCGENSQCVADARQNCQYFSICDLAVKNPPEAPSIDWRKVHKLTFG